MAPHASTPPVGRPLPPVLGAWLILLALMGCASAPTSAEPTRAIQIIVKFVPRITDPSDPAFLSALSRHAGTRLSYLRQASGGVHVLRMEGPQSEEGLKDILGRLAALPEIEYAEEVRLLRIDRK